MVAYKFPKLKTGVRFPYTLPMTIRNLYLALKGQLPFKRAFYNFLITRNAWGMFHRNSHRRGDTGKEKVMYNTKASAGKAATSMGKKRDCHFSVYKCVFCDGYHIGKNRNAFIS